MVEGSIMSHDVSFVVDTGTRLSVVHADLYKPIHLFEICISKKVELEKDCTKFWKYDCFSTIETHFQRQEHYWNKYNKYFLAHYKVSLHPIFFPYAMCIVHFLYFNFNLEFCLLFAFPNSSDVIGSEKFAIWWKDISVSLSFAMSSYGNSCFVLGVFQHFFSRHRLFHV